MSVGHWTWSALCGAGLIYLIGRPSEQPRRALGVGLILWAMFLHWFWDSIVPRNNPLTGDDCDRVYVEDLADRMMRKYQFSKLQGGLELTQYEKWHQEAFALNNTDVFTPELKRLTLPSARWWVSRIATSQRVVASVPLSVAAAAVLPLSVR